MANPSKDKGTRFEGAVARYLAWATGDPVERRALHGGKDMGDIKGLSTRGREVVVECKSYKRPTLGLILGWLEEAEVERGNASALAGALAVKLEGVSDRKASAQGRQLVCMYMDDFTALVTGQRPDEGTDE